MTIDIGQEDFGTLCICALRYCYGRQSYMPSLVQRIVAAHLKDLSDGDLKIMTDEARSESNMRLWGDGQRYGEVDWTDFYNTLDEYINGKAKKERGRDTETVAGSAL